MYSLYRSLILLYINYGTLVWGSICKTYIDKILKLQEWALRTISNSHYHDFRVHTGSLFVKIQYILNVYNMYNFETGVFMYKYSKGSLPDGFNNFFITSGLKYMIITPDIKIIIIKPKMLKSFQITQSEPMDQYFGIHLITTSESQI